MDKKKKFFKYFGLLWIIIFSIGLVRTTLQNDTYYTIKIGELIMKNGIDMLDHFSFHLNLAYTYPHWLYDTFIYVIYHYFGYTGIYISSIIIFILLIMMVFKVNKTITNSVVVSLFATFVFTLAISGFVTARAQLVSYLMFVLEIYFIEMFLKNGKKKYLFGLLLISLIICNIHVAVWPFYYIIYLPYLAEYVISKLVKKIKLNSFIKRRIIFEDNPNIKYLFITMLLSLLTGLLTPIGDTPYTYIIKTMMGNSQKYIQEHQMIRWIDSPFTIIIAIETLFLCLISKFKLRDLLMICGLVLMAISSIRHISLLTLIGTICFARIFGMFLLEHIKNLDSLIINFFSKRIIFVISFILVIIFSYFMTNMQLKKDIVNKEAYPVDAVKYINNNIDVSKMHIFNEYEVGSYLLLHDIPVFIDSRADLYTKEFSGLSYDIFDDYEFIAFNWDEKMKFYDITHVLFKKKDNYFYQTLKNRNNYHVIYEDDYFILFEIKENV